MNLKTVQWNVKVDDQRRRAYRGMSLRMGQSFSDWTRDALDQHLARCYEQLTGKPIVVQRAENTKERNARARPIIEKLLRMARDARVAPLEIVTLAETLPSRNPALWWHKPGARNVEHALKVVDAKRAQQLNDCDATRAETADAMAGLEDQLAMWRKYAAGVAAEREHAAMN